MSNIIISLVIASILFLSIRKIVVEKKKGVKCVGCPFAGKGSCHC